MNDRTTGRLSQRGAALLAGTSYIAIMVASIIAASFIDANMVVPGDLAATHENVVEHGLLFRVSTILTLAVYAGVIVLSLALYVILKPVHKDLALLALLLRVGEATIGSVSVFMGLAAGLLASGAFSAGFAGGQVDALVGLLLATRTAALDVVLIFTGLGATIFAYLFLKSRYIPATLAVWGVFTYVSMLVLSSANILHPELPAIFEVVLFGLGGLFELVFGIWLIVKGIDAGVAGK